MYRQVHNEDTDEESRWQDNEMSQVNEENKRIMPLQRYYASNHAQNLTKYFLFDRNVTTIPPDKWHEQIENWTYLDFGVVLRLAQCVRQTTSITIDVGLFRDAIVLDRALRRTVAVVNRLGHLKELKLLYDKFDPNDYEDMSKMIQVTEKLLRSFAQSSSWRDLETITLWCAVNPQVLAKFVQPFANNLQNLHLSDLHWNADAPSFASEPTDRSLADTVKQLVQLREVKITVYPAFPSSTTICRTVLAAIGESPRLLHVSLLLVPGATDLREDDVESLMSELPYAIRFENIEELTFDASELFCFVDVSVILEIATRSSAFEKSL